MRTPLSWLLGRRREDGASAVEYGLLIAGVAGLIAALVFLLGHTVRGLFDNTCGSISTASSGTMTHVSC